MNGVYFDAAYVAKCYLKEAGGADIRDLARSAAAVYTSALTIAEMSCVFHRHLRERTLNTRTAQEARDQFLDDLRNEIWTLLPITDRILRQVEFHVRRLPNNIFLRAGDAIHIVSAVDAGCNEIWTNDRHLLAAAAHFGVKGRSVGSR